ncbi:HNH endonuclease family protein, partial [Escherichia coli]|nr:HNH endonuclease family protein [Escherichia coli]
RGCNPAYSKSIHTWLRFGEIMRGSLSTEHVYWLHKIGNLTLISGSKNSEAQHYDFIKKKSIYEKLNSKSSFDLTKDVCNSSEWGLAELKMRHEKMKTQLKKLWLV